MSKKYRGSNKTIGSLKNEQAFKTYRKDGSERRDEDCPKDVQKMSNLDNGLDNDCPISRDTSIQKPKKKADRELRIFNHILNGISDVNQIAEMEGCGISNVYKARKKLQEKGKIGHQDCNVQNIGGTHPRDRGVLYEVARLRHNPRQPPDQQGGAVKEYIRVHSAQFVIDHIWKGDQYRKCQGQYTGHKRDAVPEYYEDGNRIVLNDANIEIYSEKDRSWDNIDIDEAVKDCLSYYDRIIAKVEHKTGCTLVRDGKQTIHLRKIHVAKVNDKMAVDVIQKGEKYRIYHKDGTLRMEIDTSLGKDKPETEALSHTAVGDIKEYERHTGAWLEHPGTPTSPELAEYVKQTSQAVRDLVSHGIKEQVSAQVKEEMQARVKPLDQWDSLMYG